MCLLFPGGYESYGRMSTTEDCGILHGCENGRCIRVSEGYTCDCYHGYKLDMTSMTCTGESLLTDACSCFQTLNTDICCVFRHQRVRGRPGRPLCQRSLRQHRRFVPLHLSARLRHDRTQPLCGRMSRAGPGRAGAERSFTGWTGLTHSVFSPFSFFHASHWSGFRVGRAEGPWESSFSPICSCRVGFASLLLLAV